jgi:phenylalanyl-tRNA synthetase alpha chain
MVVAPREPLSLSALLNALSIRDLTDPATGPHALQILVADASAALSRQWPGEVWSEYTRPVVSVDDNYDRLGYQPDAVARESRYTRYVSETTMLRSHTSAGVPAALRRLGSMSQPPERVLLVLPGVVYRRDSIDRLHTGTPHQLDLWLLQRGRPSLDQDDLHTMVATLIDALLPGRHWRWLNAEHPYTSGGHQVDVIDSDGPVEIAECGVAAESVLEAANLDTALWSGLALGMGLDRALMLRKGIPDVRLLRSSDRRVAEQMQNLAPYQQMSHLPVAIRDISIAADPAVDSELLGDQIREALGPRADLLEDATITSRTPYDELPAAARARLGLRPGRVNLLVRLTVRPLDRTLTSGEANDLRDRIYATIHNP